MKMPQESAISTSAAASVSSGRKPRAATAPTPISSRIDTTSPSRSMLSPKMHEACGDEDRPDAMPRRPPTDSVRAA